MHRSVVGWALASLVVTSGVGAQLSGIGSQEWSQGVLAGVTETGDHFGAAVATGDFNGDGFPDLAIGVPDEDVDGDADQGAVHVLYGSVTGLGSAGEQILVQGDLGEAGAAGDGFGFSLAAGELDGDGLDDLVIGAPGRDVDADGQLRADAGAVYTIAGDANGLDPGAFLSRQHSQEFGSLDPEPASIENAEAGDQYGFAVAILERCWLAFPGEPRGCIIVGVPGEDLEGSPTKTDAGVVSTLRMTAGLEDPIVVEDLHFHQDSVIGGVAVAGVAESGDRCGWSLAAGDFDDDGRIDLAIGCPFENDDTEINSGAVIELTLDRDGGFEPVLLASAIFSQDGAVAGAVEDDDTFGWSLAVAQLDDDGIQDLVVGVPGEDVGTANAAGAINVLYGSPSGLTATGSQLFDQSDLPVPEAEANDLFGTTLATGDFDGDGLADVAVGAPSETSGSADFAGSLTVLRGGIDRLTSLGMTTLGQQTAGVPDAAEDSDAFASALAAADFDDDGVVDLAIGVPNEDVGVGAVDFGVVDVLYGMDDGAFSRFTFDDTGDLQFESLPGLRSIEVRRLGSVRLAASVRVELVPPATATLGEDFEFSAVTLSWAAGEGGARLHVYRILDDNLIEPDEQFQLALTSPSAGAAVAAAGDMKLVTIRDDDTPDPIFADGFETGNTSRWSVVVP